jgi:hypothetical protein
MLLNGFSSGIWPLKISDKKILNANTQDYPIFSSAEIYPWRVAPQQSSLPFQFHDAKFKTKNYIYNLLNFTATFKRTPVACDSLLINYHQ